MNMKKLRRDREAHRKKHHEVRRYYNYALMRPAAEDNSTVLHIKNEQGEVEILDR